MQIQSPAQITMEHIKDVKQRLAQNAQLTASQQPQQSAQSLNAFSGLPKSPSKIVLENMQLEYEVKASSLVIKTADEMLGTMLNVRT